MPLVSMWIGRKQQDFDEEICSLKMLGKISLEIMKELIECKGKLIEKMVILPKNISITRKIIQKLCIDF